MRKLTQRTEAVVSLSALEHNGRRVREIIGSGVELMAAPRDSRTDWLEV